MVALQIGVGSPSTPAANAIVIVKVPALSVPVNVPRLFLWQALHDPSVGSGARVVTVPEIDSPDCVIARVTTVMPCESVLVPVQLPLRSTDAGVGVAGATGVGVVGCAGAPHATASRIVATVTRRRDFMKRSLPADSIAGLREAPRT